MHDRVASTWIRALPNRPATSDHPVGAVRPLLRRFAAVSARAEASSRGPLRTADSGRAGAFGLRTRVVPASSDCGLGSCRRLRTADSGRAGLFGLRTRVVPAPSDSGLGSCRRLRTADSSRAGLFGLRTRVAPASSDCGLGSCRRLRTADSGHVRSALSDRGRLAGSLARAHARVRASWTAGDARLPPPDHPKGKKKTSSPCLDPVWIQGAGAGSRADKRQIRSSSGTTQGAGAGSRADSLSSDRAPARLEAPAPDRKLTASAPIELRHDSRHRRRIED